MNIVLGITGSIAAYKACTLIREFVKRGHEVQVVITPAGKEFITPVTLSALTSKPVISDFFAQRDGTWHSHVQLGLWADAMVVAPATASTLAKMAHGVADNMLITTYLSMRAPVFVAPAMDLDMWAHPATQANLELLRQRGVTIVEPASGELASHLVGKGRMEEPEQIAKVVLDSISSVEERHESPASLAGRRVLITAGPTYERIDPVRFIGNYSSGKMGIALAEECARRGARVELILGPTNRRTQAEGVTITDVESANEMWEAATRLFPDTDAAILCAAVADFTPDTVATQKLRREAIDRREIANPGEEGATPNNQDEGLVLHLRPTKDIAASLGRMKRSGQVMIGFALETHDEHAHAIDKLHRKNLDAIVLNSLQDEGAGFRHDTNKVTIITPSSEIPYPLKPKTEVAADIIDTLESLLGGA